MNTMSTLDRERLNRLLIVGESQRCVGEHIVEAASLAEALEDVRAGKNGEFDGEGRWTVVGGVIPTDDVISVRAQLKLSGEGWEPLC